MREKELRLALVCYGGVSLAVYMHGITKELWRLVRASRAFHDGAPSELGSEAIIHLTGASGSFVAAMPESGGLSGEMQLSARPEHVHVFDGTSGQRLAD